MDENIEFLTIEEASGWASEYLHRNVTTANISYLINYGRVKKHGKNGATLVSKKDLVTYYDSYYGKRENRWTEILGDDLNWALSFDNLKEADTTKHVHRLHPYKGKFIPQLVAYFLDDHTDTFKKSVYFKPGDIILDPFCGSGTALIQANELGLHAIGIDISEFNSLISNVKVKRHNLVNLQQEIRQITYALREYVANSKHLEFENRLLEALAVFNNKYFPSPDYKVRLNNKEIDETTYVEEKLLLFNPIYEDLVSRYGIHIKNGDEYTFLNKWYLPTVRDEIEFINNKLNLIKDEGTKDVIRVILSRTIRSCRATTHSDLGTLLEPITSPYYCIKHSKICKPLFSMKSWWERYSVDTVSRLAHFQRLRTDTEQFCLTGDSRIIDIPLALRESFPSLATKVTEKKINGIFSSPPYVGLIDYHEQHAYAYELFGFTRRDELEIGPLFKGTGAEAKLSYVQGISSVLRNCRKFMIDDFDVFLVANDRSTVYPKIALLADMVIVDQFKRPVLNRTERDKSAYAEIIFHLKANKT